MKHINLGQKQMTTPCCKNNLYLEPVFLAKVENIELNDCGRKYLKLLRIALDSPRLLDTGGIWHISFPIDCRYIKHVNNTGDEE